MPAAVGRPERSEFSSHYAPFVAVVPDGDVMDLLTSAGTMRDATVAGISEAAALRRPPAGKWTIRTTLGHLADMERVLAYRALRIARNDPSSLAGIDQDLYAIHANAEQRTIADLRVELRALRTSTVCLLASLPADVWERRDVIENDAVSLRALAYIIVGHDFHHLQQLADRFGIRLRQTLLD